MNTQLFEIKQKMLSNWQYFPWDWFGTSTPSFGSVSSYICTMMVKYVKSEDRVFYSSRPALFELKKRAEREGDELARSIVNYCEDLEDMWKWERDSIAQEVLDFLTRYRQFSEDFHNMFDKKALEGYFK